MGAKGSVGFKTGGSIIQRTFKAVGDERQEPGGARMHGDESNTAAGGGCRPSYKWAPDGWKTILLTQ